ncbi:MAG: hypothetical protein SWX82_28720 [Cyanobacteriota bacterium]|nr:hypothetical protein [Cyanobacteriota bacterium]
MYKPHRHNQNPVGRPSAALAERQCHSPQSKPCRAPFGSSGGTPMPFAPTVEIKTAVKEEALNQID